MAHLIDTSVLVDMERCRATFDDLADAGPPGAAGIAAITASELLVGVFRATSTVHRRRRALFVEAILDTLPILPFNLESARVHARIAAELLRQGNRIGAHDLLVAATAYSLSYDVLTSNAREFTRISGLTALQPEWRRFDTAR